MKKASFTNVSVVDLRPDPDQPRKVIDPDALSELAASIKAYGVLQPLLFRVGDQGWLYIVSGERATWRPSRRASWSCPPSAWPGTMRRSPLSRTSSARI